MKKRKAKFDFVQKKKLRPKDLLESAYFKKLILSKFQNGAFVLF